MTSRPVLWKPWRPVLEHGIHLNNWTRGAHVPALPACACSLFACGQHHFELFELFGEQHHLFGRSWWLLSSDALWSKTFSHMPWSRQQAHQARKKQQGAAPRKRVKNLGQSVSLEHQSGAEGARKKKKKHFFQAPKSCFFKRPLQANETAIVATWAIGLLLFPGVKAKNGFIRSGKKTTFQAPNSWFFFDPVDDPFCLKNGIYQLCWPSRVGMWLGKKHFGRSKTAFEKKTTFRSPKSCFFFELVGDPFCLLKRDISTFLTKPSGHVARIKTFRALKTASEKKTTFRAPKSCFFSICSWKGLPLQWSFGELEKASDCTWKA